ncbi:hypothetical protein QUF90_07480 [Desulfococcaceae bacterium HSG9]|nr:hypothetical protein [Desulfococcaceae bacterium HSG9]
MPSQSTLRQLIDLIRERDGNILKDASAEMLFRKMPAIPPIQTGVGEFVPPDMDVSPFDNSKTQKEGVSGTYKGCDSYAPMFAYLGAEGYWISAELREGGRHCRKNTPDLLTILTVQDNF